MDNLFNLNGKLALITGSSRGIGYSLAEGLASYGAKVIINSRSISDSEKAALCLLKRGYDAVACAFDVSNEEQVTKNIAMIENEIGAIDILINNAGIQRRTEFTECTSELWRNVMDINVNATFLLSREVVKGMKQRNQGKIVNICSLLSEFGRNSIVPYTSSKGAVKMMTKGLCTELAKYNIQINGIGPGYFETEMNQALVEDKEFDAWLCNRTPAQRWGKVEELIGATVLLSSKASSFINGQIIYVDGGISASL